MPKAFDEGEKQAIRSQLMAAGLRRFAREGVRAARIEDICRDAGIEYYNTLEKIPAGGYPREYAIHYMHPRAEGHAVLAEALEKYLSSLNWLDPK